MTSLTFHQKIVRSNTNNVLQVPNLSYLNFVLSGIEFKTDCWEFEAVVRSSGSDLVKLSTSYFQHHKTVDMSKHLAKVEEGDKIELVIKPKHAKKDFILQIKYNYIESLGSLYYQGTFRFTDLEDDSTCCLMADITQNSRPTRLEINAEAPIEHLELVPKFVSDDFSGDDYVFEMNPTGNSAVIDFTSDDFPDGVLNLLKFYRLCLKLNSTSSNLDTPVHFLAYGFRN